MMQSTTERGRAFGVTDVLECTILGWTKAHELERLLPWSRQVEQLVAAVDA